MGNLGTEQGQDGVQEVERWWEGGELRHGAGGRGDMKMESGTGGKAESRAAHGVMTGVSLH